MGVIKLFFKEHVLSAYMLYNCTFSLSNVMQNIDFLLEISLLNKLYLYYLFVFQFLQKYTFNMKLRLLVLKHENNTGKTFCWNRDAHKLFCFILNHGMQ